VNQALRAEFPIFDQSIHGKALVYLDNAATTQKPKAVLEAVRVYNEQDCSNVHRGIHALSVRADESYEAARQTVCDFIDAPSTASVIFTKGTTDSINTVAQSYGEAFVQAGDEILVTEMEHHSNWVPWQLLCKRKGATLKVVPVCDDGSISTQDFEKALTERTRLVAFAHVSNALGTLNPVSEWVQMAKARGIHTLIDGAQAVAHLPVSFKKLACDFYVFSAHKLFGPTGTGALIGNPDLLEQMEPVQGGGDMIKTVELDGTTWNDLPWKFEAGTPNISGVIGMAAAMKWLLEKGIEKAAQHERSLVQSALARLRLVPNLRLIGEPKERVSVISFVIDGVHPSDLGTLLDLNGVAIRTGHHCAQPLMKRFQIPGTSRLSFSIYNDQNDVDALFLALDKALGMLGKPIRRKD
jgi:cysteine desulfurase / selenocysteine lyase